VKTLPLVVLAVGAIAAGWIGIPAAMSFGADINLFHHFLEPVIASVGAPHAAHPGLTLEWALILLSVFVAALGVWVAGRLWGGERGLAGDVAFARRFPALRAALENKYWVDEAYDRFVVRPLAALARALWKVVDILVIDGTIHVGAFIAEITGDLGRLTTTGNVRNYALYVFVGVVALFCWMIL
jgi:NADH-quinone oxidoreductase subunit L